MIIGVVGGEQVNGDTYSRAMEVGELIARRRGIVICGGRGGVMEAVCKGAKKAGGLTIGILPGMTREEANPYVDVAIATGMGTARNVIIVRTADVFIAIGGRYGTLSEIAHALDHGKKVVCLGTWRLDRMGVDKERFIVADSPEEAVELAFEGVK